MKTSERAYLTRWKVPNTDTQGHLLTSTTYNLACTDMHTLTLKNAHTHTLNDKVILK